MSLCSVLGPTVQFPSPGTRHQLEPLSDASLDSSQLTLTLLRTGDLSLRSRVWYGTVDGSAMAGRDYSPVSGVITFAEGQGNAELAIPILANHELSEDTNFTVQLALPGPAEDSVHDPTSIGTNHTVTVVIENRELLGSYFPALPRLCSVEEVGGVRTCAMEVLYFDLPLMCITVSVSSFS